MTDAARPAYVILVRDRMIDGDEFATYSQKARAAREGHAVTPLVIYGRHEVLEGADVEGVAMLRFPSFAEAQAWYHSPAYQEALRHRLAGAEYRVLIVEGA